MPFGLVADDSGIAKPGTDVFVATWTSEAHGPAPVSFAIAIVLSAVEAQEVSTEFCHTRFFLTRTRLSN